MLLYVDGPVRDTIHERNSALGPMDPEKRDDVAAACRSLPQKILGVYPCVRVRVMFDPLAMNIPRMQSISLTMTAIVKDIRVLGQVGKHLPNRSVTVSRSEERDCQRSWCLLCLLAIIEYEKAPSKCRVLGTAFGQKYCIGTRKRWAEHWTLYIGHQT